MSSSLLLLCPDKPGRTGRYGAWRETARAALAGVDVEPLAVLVRGPAGYLPDFLLPPPDDPSPTFEAELERLRATEPRRVAAEARMTHPDETPEALRPYLERPDEALEALADVLAEYWRRTLAPSWPQMRALLEGEIITRARRLAQGGPQALLADLAPSISWDDPVLAIDKKHCGDIDAAGRGLLIVPVVFGLAASFVSVEGPWRPTVSYAPRGVGLLWSQNGEGEGDVPLEILLGRGRATVLLALAEPASTTALALRLGVTAEHRLGAPGGAPAGGSRRAAPGGPPRPVHAHPARRPSRRASGRRRGRRRDRLIAEKSRLRPAPNRLSRVVRDT